MQRSAEPSDTQRKLSKLSKLHASLALDPSLRDVYLALSAAAGASLLHETARRSMQERRKTGR